jgi:methylated-DNA-[protein]-cysteine S-methyltransferase
MSAGLLRHTVFKTPWGYFGLAATGDTVQRTCLPGLDRAQVLQALLAGLADAPFDRGLLGGLQQRITAYFEGENVDFSTDPAVDLAGRGTFDRTVLSACRQIGPGQTATYSELAVRIGKPGAGRAVGNALARNPIPLIIPCHRVLRADGGLGGFSAPGGTAAKQRMLQHEQFLRPATSDTNHSGHGSRTIQAIAEPCNRLL